MSLPPRLDRAGNRIGLLTITTTSRDGFGVTRLETDAGRYQVSPNCLGGTLTFNLSSRPMQFDFWFSDLNRQLFIVSTTPGKAATGRAGPAPAGCPAGIASPIELLLGRSTFAARGIDPQVPYAIAGAWNATLNGPIGLLAISATSNLGQEGSITRLEGDTGRYFINPDCTSGTLTLNLSSRPVQFDFWFLEGFQELYFISTNYTPAIGAASR